MEEITLREIVTELIQRVENTEQKLIECQKLLKERENDIQILVPREQSSTQT